MFVKSMRRRVAVLLIGMGIPGLPMSAQALTIEIRYDFDSQGFFDQPGSRAALREVCDFFESVIGDRLARIDSSEWPRGNTWDATIKHPGTGSSRSLGNIVVPEGVFLLYAGGRGLGSAAQGGPGGYGVSYTSRDWLDRVRNRGQGVTEGSHASDFGPWGGTVTFDTGRGWNFSLDDPAPPGADFVSIALHEVAHALGFGTADSWDAKISGSAFVGALSASTFGSSVPLSGTGHWRDDGMCVWYLGHDPDNPLNVLSGTLPQFGVPAGLDQIALMDPSSCATGPFLRVFTSLDLAGLQDVGWEVSVPVDPESLDLGVTIGPEASRVTLAFRTVSGALYLVQRSEDGVVWEDLGGTISGDGDVIEVVDDAAAEGRCFYRVLINPSGSGGVALALAPESFVPTGPDFATPQFAARAPRVCTDCEFHDHEGDRP